ncbi:MAG: hypothetical protein ACREKF_06405 [Candidatus Methylomirabilales bacterium]
MSRTSGQRADTAQAIVQWYADLVSGTVDPSDEILVDVLADLQHLAHREGWDFDALLALARMHYHAEADWPSSKDWIQGGAST